VPHSAAATEIVELNSFNGGLLLDLELPHVGNLTGQDTTTERLWDVIRKLIKTHKQGQVMLACVMGGTKA